MWSSSDMIDSLRQGEESIGVIGAGFIGTTTALFYAHEGVKSVLYDVDKAKISKYNCGECDVVNLENWSGMSLKEFVDQGMINPSHDFDSLKECRIFFRWTWGMYSLLRMLMQPIACTRYEWEWVRISTVFMLSLLAMCLSLSIQSMLRGGGSLAVLFHVSMVTDLKCESLRRTAHLKKAEEILKCRVPFRTEHAAQALLIDLQFPGNIGDGFGGVQIVAQQRLTCFHIVHQEGIGRLNDQFASEGRVRLDPCHDCLPEIPCKRHFPDLPL